METKTYIKVKYEDNDGIKILKGYLTSQDEFSITIEVAIGKQVTIGRRYIVSFTNVEATLNSNKGEQQWLTLPNQNTTL